MTNIEILNLILLIAVCLWNAVFCTLYVMKTVRLELNERNRKTGEDLSPFRSGNNNLVGYRNVRLFDLQILPLMLSVIAFLNCDRIQDRDLAWRMLVIGFCIAVALSVLFSVLLEIKLHDKTLFRKRFAYLFSGGGLVFIMILIPFVFLGCSIIGFVWTL